MKLLCLAVLCICMPILDMIVDRQLPAPKAKTIVIGQDVGIVYRGM